MTAARLRRAAWWLGLAAVLALAVATRVGGLDEFLTPDETRWTCRSANFWNALAEGRPAGTYQKEHPGVITMWLGGLGLPVAPEGDWAVACREIPMSDLVEEAPRPALDTITERLIAGRLRIALAVALSVGLATWLLGSLLGPRVALMSGALLALDPFTVALSRVIHLDALTSLLMLVAYLLFLVWLVGGRRKRHLVASGVVAGLAALNKSPAIFLVPMVGLSLVLQAVLHRGVPWGSVDDEPPARWGRWALGLVSDVARPLGPWLMAAVAAYVLAWPAMWVDPLGALAGTFGGAADYAANPHEGHNYFLGSPVLDPGAWFYPVAWWFRTRPVTLFGLALAVAIAGTWGWSRWRGGDGSGSPDTGPRTSAADRELAAIALLVLFAFCFAVGMTLGKKKFDRYLLPAIPPLLIVAGWGWARGAAWLGARLAGALEPDGPRGPRGRRRGTGRSSQAFGRWVASDGIWAIAWGVLLVFLLAAGWAQRPFYLTVYNPLAGGQARAPEVLLVGWGEGTGEPARWLSGRPDADELQVATRYRSAVGPLLRGTALEMNKIDPATVDYYLFYINQLQRNLDPELIERFGLRIPGEAAGTPGWWAAVQAGDGPVPVHVTAIGDVVYSLVFANENWVPAARAITEHGDADRDAVLVREDSGFARNAEMNVPVIGVPPDADRAEILEILRGAFAEHERLWWVRYDDLIPRPGLTYADHQLAVTAFETWRQEFPELHVSRFELPPDAGPDALGADMALRSVDVVLGDRLAMDHIGLSSTPIQWGRGVEVAVGWRALNDLDVNFTAFLHLIDETGRRWAQQDRRIGDADLVPTARWDAGRSVTDSYFLRVPPGTPPGAYTLLVGAYDPSTEQRLPPSLEGDPGDGGGIEGALSVRDDAVAIPVRVAPSPFEPEPQQLGLDRIVQERVTEDLTLIGVRGGGPLVAGRAARIGLAWRVEGATPADRDPGQGRVHIEVRDPEGRTVAGMTTGLVPERPDASWEGGTVLLPWYELTLDPRAVAGDGQLIVAPIGAEGTPMDSSSVRSPLQIDGPRRSFEEPEIAGTRIAATVGDLATLVGAEVGPAHVRAGAPVTVTLHWRAERDGLPSNAAGHEGGAVKLFVHLVGQHDDIVAQYDGPPDGGDRPTDTWREGEYVTGRTVLTIPQDAPGGRYRVLVGLYEPSTGDRLDVRGPSERLPGQARIDVGQVTVR